MSIHSMDLGSLQIANAAAGLQASLHSYADLLPSFEDDFAILAEKLTIAASNAHSIDRPAVICDGRFHLVIGVECAPNITVAMDRLIKTAASRLQNAFLWSQLQLDVIAVHCSFEPHSAASIDITLARSDDFPDQSARCKHRLRGQGLPSTAAVSSGAQVLRLRNICLKLHISHCLPRSADRTDSALGKDFVAAAHEDMVEDPEHLEHLDDLEDLDYQSDVEDLEHIDPLEDLDDFPNADMETQPWFASRRFYSHPNILFPSELPLEGDAPDSLYQISAPDHPIPAKRSYSMNDANSRTRERGLHEAMLELLQVSVQLAVSANNKAIDHDFQVLESSSFKPLASIMPDIWSPGYHEKCSTRYLFLPTISHALSHVGGLHASNPSLQLKVEELCRREARLHSSMQGGGGQSCSEVQVMMADQLWQTARRTLFDARAVKNLRIHDRTTVQQDDMDSHIHDTDNSQPAQVGFRHSDDDQDVFSDQDFEETDLINLDPYDERYAQEDTLSICSSLEDLMTPEINENVDLISFPTDNVHTLPSWDPSHAPVEEHVFVPIHDCRIQTFEP